MIELQPGGSILVQSFLAITLGILVLFLGKSLNQRFKPLREYNIPEPVTGGLLVALALWLLYLLTGYRVGFELHARDVLLVYFFTTIGINARVSDLKAGGQPLAVLVASVALLLVVQNALGIAVSVLLGRPPAMGLLAGSVALLGGHGTAIAWAPAIADRPGLANAMEIGVLCATAGLVMASVAGGPVARYLVNRYHLRGQANEAPTVGVQYGDAEPAIDYFSFLRAILAIHISAAIGVLIHEWLQRAGFNLPLFVPCLLAGLVLTNGLPRLAPRIKWPSRTPALALIAEVSLGVFLAMSLMSMQLWTLADLALPLFVVLALQCGLVMVFAVFVVFRALRRTYDAAVIATGLIGFALGATPTAMANMTAVTQRHGPSQVAFLIVPLVGAFFIDLLNAFAIRVFLSMV
jgi:ESS family glutamate:Na+ symporter